jgi:hypothetical protein
MQRPPRLRRRSLCVPVEELDLDAQHLVEAPATLIDVVVAAGTAIQLSPRGASWVTRTAGSTGAIVSCSATYFR